ncbi:hypothetical protein ACFL2O_04625 [Thermodesulfobacteriota bacterium]
MTEKDTHTRELNKLEMDGWKKQFIAREPRLNEALQMYREAGFEVTLESLLNISKYENGGECMVCFEGFEDQYKIIYTRRIKDENSKNKG